ncbi:hypothetical protein PO124_34400 [Bacillus licheniformis]|nr:hypothetical protein [Bacillus licheniformis]
MYEMYGILLRAKARYQKYNLNIMLEDLKKRYIPHFGSHQKVKTDKA